jgi:hypothetical protein
MYRVYPKIAEKAFQKPPDSEIQLHGQIFRDFHAALEGLPGQGG